MSSDYKSELDIEAIRESVTRNTFNGVIYHLKDIADSVKDIKFDWKQKAAVEMIEVYLMFIMFIVLIGTVGGLAYLAKILYYLRLGA